VKKKIPLIPVLLPGMDEIPKTLVFLAELQSVKFHRSLDEREALDQLEWGITSSHLMKRSMEGKDGADG
jgi:hypothetical protein